MKLAIVLALSRFYHDLPRWRVSSIYGLFGAFLIIFIPMFFIMRQPDLGTTLLVAATGLSIIFLAGIKWRLLAGFLIFSFISIPLFFIFGLKTYQRERILTFLDPTHDPNGASYHITQSKIALGSGGFNGKGFMSGTQRQLDYVPENRTDFIFTVIGEEFGFIGSLSTIAIYMFIIGICVWLSFQCKQVYSKLLILGFTITFALYIFINLAMIMGLVPVVGVPLPLMSYGGTVLLTVMTGFGLILSAYINRDSKLPSSKFKN
jgi:rod shape determining protein RodA